MALLNKRSFRKHLDDILSDKYLLYNDIKVPTEAQVEVRENTVDLKLKLEKHFTVHFTCNFQKYRSIGIVYSIWIQLVDSTDHDSMTIHAFSKMKFSLRPVKIALL